MAWCSDANAAAASLSVAIAAACSLQLPAKSLCRVLQVLPLLANHMVLLATEHRHSECFPVRSLVACLEMPHCLDELRSARSVQGDNFGELGAAPSALVAVSQPKPAAAHYSARWSLIRR